MKKLLLALLLSVNSVFANELTLYFIPSPTGMDWSTPSNLAKSALKNRLSLKPRFMGHVFVELKCGENHELTGMAGKNFDYLNQLLVQQKGLGILYHSFDGGLEDKSEIGPELQEYLKTQYTNFAKFVLNEGQCGRALQYLSEYREKNVGRFYGLANRPLHGEGSGCTAFGVSFLDVLNILDHDMKESWSQTVNIPLELAGPPLREEGVSLFKIMFNAGQWANENEKHQKLTFWDPDKMYSWVRKKVAARAGDYKILKLQNTSGVVFDKSHFPVPEEPIWRQHLDPENPKKILQVHQN